jgi:hypothetical protein
MLIENALRPEYSYYLNADAIQQVEGDFEYQKVLQSTLPVKNNVDTLIGYQYVRPIADNMQNPMLSGGDLAAMPGVNPRVVDESRSLQNMKNTMLRKFVQNYDPAN